MEGKEDGRQTKGGREGVKGRERTREHTCDYVPLGGGRESEDGRVRKGEGEGTKEIENERATHSNTNAHSLSVSKCV